ncbi:MAG: hypothetical protein F6K22_35435 [Okeania sp. SIO2F4]|uniref:hypothetical protein n=1 Tax=Okeania sp. SIO2F4 TaxID=2607790 RepID=UPI00142937F3|nr:hypothetical protein [Okeania sp. SIO2F4]NES07615.1 hypothetical protein [Okeania sp. SIO2F4]
MQLSHNPEINPIERLWQYSEQLNYQTIYTINIYITTLDFPFSLILKAVRILPVIILLF